MSGHIKLSSVIWIMGLITLLFACKSEYRPTLSEQQMENVLFELHLADVLTEAKGGALSLRNATRNEHYDEILETFELQRKEFYTNYVHYVNHPEKMDSIYVRLIRKIEKRMEISRSQIYDNQKDQEKWDAKEKKEGAAGLKAPSDSLKAGSEK